MQKINRSQTGFVSILVTMILMVVTSLVVLSFAYLARQNQTRNLNQQLSTQAFYAAESGVNGAVAKIRSALNSGSPLPSSSNCSDTGSGNFGDPQLGDPSLNVRYTCVLVGQNPTSLTYDSIGTDSSTVAHIITSGANTLQISWQDTGTNAGFSDSSKFQLPQKPLTGFLSDPAHPAGTFSRPTATFPNQTGILRAEIIPIPAGGVTDNLALLQSSRNYFLYPQANSSPAAAGLSSMSAPDGTWISGECNTGNTGTNFPRFCNVKITGISGDLYLRLKAIYKPVAVTVRALPNSGPTTPGVSIAGVQAVIDATGKAQNVLRRIQVRLPLDSSYLWPEYALETSDTICKRFSVWPGGAKIITPSKTKGPTGFSEGDLYDPSHTAATIYGSRNDPGNDALACAIPGLAIPSFP